jgi:hypothetical protein
MKLHFLTQHTQTTCSGPKRQALSLTPLALLVKVKQTLYLNI